MRFFALLPVRDEADIIEQALRHLLTWADAVYVFDTGSLDETWEIVQDLSLQDKRIKPLRKDAVVFDNALVRGWIFEQARREMREGDWFTRSDADEIYHVTPPAFVEGRLSRGESVVWHQYYDFRLTAAEVRAWQAGREGIASRRRPVEERRRWFTVDRYSEPRLCKYRASMRWPANASFPVNAGFIARERIPIRHYLHRDPPQMDRRARVRELTMALRGGPLFTGYVDGDIGRLRNMKAAGDCDPESLGRRLGDALAREWWRFITPDDHPGLQFWAQGAPLPAYPFRDHLAPPLKRMAQRFFHAFLLPRVDSFRRQWPDSAYPERWTEQEMATIEAALARPLQMPSIPESNAVTVRDCVAPGRR